MHSRINLFLLLSVFLLQSCSEDREIKKNLGDEIVGLWSQIQSIDTEGNDVITPGCSIQIDLTDKELGEVYESGESCSGSSTNNGSFLWEVDESLKIITFQRLDQEAKTAFLITLTSSELRLKRSGVPQANTLVFVRK